MTPILNNATFPQLEQAVADNHRELFRLNAITPGGEVKTFDGLELTYNGPGKASMISFPSLTENNAGKILDEMMDWYQRASTFECRILGIKPITTVKYWYKIIGTRLSTRLATVLDGP